MRFNKYALFRRNITSNKLLFFLQYLLYRKNCLDYVRSHKLSGYISPLDIVPWTCHSFVP